MARFHYPIDPSCPEVARYIEENATDPIIEMSGCWDEFFEAFVSRHHRGCKRCQNFGARNVEVI